MRWWRRGIGSEGEKGYEMNFTPPYIYCGLYEQEEFQRAIACVKAVCQQVIERETPQAEPSLAEWLAIRPATFDADWATAYMMANASSLSNAYGTATGQAIAIDMYRQQLASRRSGQRGLLISLGLSNLLRSVSRASEG